MDNATYYICSNCKLRFSDGGSLEMHLMQNVCGSQTVSGQVGENVKIVVDNHAKEKDPSPNQGETFICGECGKCFASSDLLSSHMNSHIMDDNSLFECGKCSVNFKTCHELEKHVRQSSCHISDIFACGMCGKTFSNKLELEEHLLYKKCSLSVEVQPESEYVCGNCQRNFASAETLIVHTPSCSVTFVDKSAPESVEIQNICTEPPTQRGNTIVNNPDKQINSENSNSNGSEHMPDNVTNQRKSLEKNENKGNSDYWCDKCKRSFTSSGFRNHIKSKKCGQSNICAYCGKQYTTAFYARRHEKSICKLNHGTVLSKTVGTISNEQMEPKCVNTTALNKERTSDDDHVSENGFGAGNSSSEHNCDPTNKSVPITSEIHRNNNMCQPKKAYQDVEVPEVVSRLPTVNVMSNTVHQEANDLYISPPPLPGNSSSDHNRDQINKSVTITTGIHCNQDMYQPINAYQDVEVPNVVPRPPTVNVMSATVHHKENDLYIPPPPLPQNCSSDSNRDQTNKGVPIISGIHRNQDICQPIEAYQDVAVPKIVKGLLTANVMSATLQQKTHDLYIPPPPLPPNPPSEQAAHYNSDFYNPKLAPVTDPPSYVNTQQHTVRQLPPTYSPLQQQRPLHTCKSNANENNIEQNQQLSTVNTHSWNSLQTSWIADGNDTASKVLAQPIPHTVGPGIFVPQQIPDISISYPQYPPQTSDTFNRQLAGQPPSFLRPHLQRPNITVRSEGNPNSHNQTTLPPPTNTSPTEYSNNNGGVQQLIPELMPGQIYHKTKTNSTSQHSGMKHTNISSEKRNKINVDNNASVNERNAFPVTHTARDNSSYHSAVNCNVPTISDSEPTDLTTFGLATCNYKKIHQYLKIVARSSNTNWYFRKNKTKNRNSRIFITPLLQKRQRIHEVLTQIQRHNNRTDSGNRAKSKFSEAVHHSKRTHLRLINQQWIKKKPSSHNIEAAFQNNQKLSTVVVNTETGMLVKQKQNLINTLQEKRAVLNKLQESVMLRKTRGISKHQNDGAAVAVCEKSVNSQDNNGGIVGTVNDNSNARSPNNIQTHSYYPTVSNVNTDIRTKIVIPKKGLNTRTVNSAQPRMSLPAPRPKTDLEEKMSTVLRNRLENNMTTKDTDTQNKIHESAEMSSLDKDTYDILAPKSENSDTYEGNPKSKLQLNMTPLNKQPPAYTKVKWSTLGGKPIDTKLGDNTQPTQLPPTNVRKDNNDKSIANNIESHNTQTHNNSMYKNSDGEKGTKNISEEMNGNKVHQTADSTTEINMCSSFNKSVSIPVTDLVHEAQVKKVQIFIKKLDTNSINKYLKKYNRNQDKGSESNVHMNYQYNNGSKEASVDEDIIGQARDREDKNNTQIYDSHKSAVESSHCEIDENSDSISEDSDSEGYEEVDVDFEEDCSVEKRQTVNTSKNERKTPHTTQSKKTAKFSNSVKMKKDHNDVGEEDTDVSEEDTDQYNMDDNTSTSESDDSGDSSETESDIGGSRRGSNIERNVGRKRKRFKNIQQNDEKGNLKNKTQISRRNSRTRVRLLSTTTDSSNSSDDSDFYDDVNTISKRNKNSSGIESNKINKPSEIRKSKRKNIGKNVQYKNNIPNRAKRKSKPASKELNSTCNTECKSVSLAQKANTYYMDSGITIETDHDTDSEIKPMKQKKHPTTRLNISSINDKDIDNTKPRLTMTILKTSPGREVQFRSTDSETGNVGKNEKNAHQVMNKSDSSKGNASTKQSAKTRKRRARDSKQNSVRMRQTITAKRLKKMSVNLQESTSKNKYSVTDSGASTLKTRTVKIKRAQGENGKNAERPPKRRKISESKLAHRSKHLPTSIINSDFIQNRGICKENFVCGICEKLYQNSKELEQHMLDHAAEQAGEFVCGLCEKSFKDNGELQKHMVLHFTKSPKGVTAVVEVSVCEWCKEKFTSVDELLKHKLGCSKRSNIIACKVCNSTFEHVETLNEHQKFCDNGTKKMSPNEKLEDDYKINLQKTAGRSAKDSIKKVLADSSQIHVDHSEIASVETEKVQFTTNHKSKLLNKTSESSITNTEKTDENNSDGKNRLSKLLKFKPKNVFNW